MPCKMPETARVHESVLFMDRNLLDARVVQGRITEVDLPAAEKTFPGITVVYEQLPEKPKTFLQLVWLYEELVEELRGEVEAEMLYAGVLDN